MVVETQLGLGLALPKPMLAINYHFKHLYTISNFNGVPI